MKLGYNFLIIGVAGFLMSSCKEKDKTSMPENDQQESSVTVSDENKEDSSVINQESVKPEKQVADKENKKTEEMPSRKKYVPLTDEELRKTLTPIQYQVTKHEATERPWTNEFDKHRINCVNKQINLTKTNKLNNTTNQFD